MSIYSEVAIAFAVLLIIVLVLLRKNKLPVKFALVWLFSSLVMIIVGCFPRVMDFVKNILGFQLASNVILTVFLGLLILITISLTIIISEQEKKIKLLVQEVSLLKEKINK